MSHLLRTTAVEGFYLPVEEEDNEMRRNMKVSSLHMHNPNQVVSSAGWEKGLAGE